MAELDKQLDENPNLAGDMVRLDIRNRKAHLELVNFERKQQFLYKHPILIQRKYEKQLIKLRAENLESFMHRYASNKRNIQRYASKIKRKQFRTPEEKQNWIQHMKDSNLEMQLMETIINQHKQ